MGLLDGFKKEPKTEEQEGISEQTSSEGVNGDNIVKTTATDDSGKFDYEPELGEGENMSAGPGIDEVLKAQEPESTPNQIAIEDV